MHNSDAIAPNGERVTPQHALDYYHNFGVKLTLKCPGCGLALILHRTTPPHFEHKANEAGHCEHRAVIGR